MQEVFTSELENLLKMLDIAELEQHEDSNKDGGKSSWRGSYVGTCWYINLQS